MPAVDSCASAKPHAVQGRSGFRKDIEGLRALAILLVVAVHAGFPVFRGGFIGVDVFFVLSGYLITGLIASEIERTGGLSFGRFYARRMRRLLPALFLMLIVTLFAGAALLSPFDNIALAQSAAAAAAYSSNLWFMAHFIDYFSTGVASNPLLHTWSLGVEEQFYLVWPLLILLAMRKGKTRRALLGPFIGVFILSAAACMWLTHTHQPIAFFSSPTRAWEFAAGGIAEVMPMGRLAAFFRHRTMPWIGSAVILASGIWISEIHPFPGIVAILPVIGTVMVLVAGREAVAGAKTPSFLSNPVLQTIGAVSYSWYLWHWPVLVFGRILMPHAGPLTVAGLVVFSFGIAWATHVLIENPLRFNGRLAASTPRSIAMGAGLTIAGVLTAFCCMGMARHVANSSPEQAFLRATAGNRADSCTTGYHRTELKPCVFGDRTGTTAIVLFGDSHAGQWLPALTRAAAENHWRVITLLKASCPSVTVPIYNPRLERTETECAVWRRRALGYIAGLRPAMVLLSNSADYVRTRERQDGYARLSPEQWEDGVFATLSSLRDSGAKVVLLRDTPRPNVDIPVCLSRSLVHPGLFPVAACYAKERSALAESVWSGEVSAARHFANVIPVDMTRYFCSSGTCPPEVNGVVVYRDTNHISADFAASLAGALAPELAASMEPRSTDSASLDRLDLQSRLSPRERDAVTDPAPQEKEY